MRGLYQLHLDGDCGPGCPVCQWEDAQEPDEETNE